MQLSSECPPAATLTYLQGYQESANGLTGNEKFNNNNITLIKPLKFFSLNVYVRNFDVKIENPYVTIELPWPAEFYDDIIACYLGDY